ncbi:MAG: hypothetical protein Q8S19_04290 [Bacillota bacterium]|nr:hypothetical protein [Bacillota bacterium]
MYYTYSNEGQEWTETNGTVTNFVYDDRSLLTRITYSDGTYAEYTYDIAGPSTASWVQLIPRAYGTTQQEN